MNEAPSDDPGARSLAEAILVQDDDAHVARLEELDRYVLAQLAGEASDALFPLVAQHLDTCVECAQAYEVAYGLYLAEKQAPVPATIPAPNLSFLDRNALQSFLETFTTTVQQTATGFRLTLSSSQLGPSEIRRPIVRYRSDTILAEVTTGLPGTRFKECHLSIEQAHDSQDDCHITVQIIFGGEAYPQPEVPVILKFGTQQYNDRTNQDGIAVFSNIPIKALPDLQVEIDAEGATETI